MGERDALSVVSVSQTCAPFLLEPWRLVLMYGDVGLRIRDEARTSCLVVCMGLTEESIALSLLLDGVIIDFDASL